jgi:hypothetical protein
MVWVIWTRLFFDAQRSGFYRLYHRCYELLSQKTLEQQEIHAFFTIVPPFTVFTRLKVLRLNSKFTEQNG